MINRDKAIKATMEESDFVFSDLVAERIVDRIIETCEEDVSHEDSSGQNVLGVIFDRRAANYELPTLLIQLSRYRLALSRIARLDPTLDHTPLNEFADGVIRGFNCRKVRHGSERSAEEQLRSLKRRGHLNLHVYICPHCSNYNHPIFHVGHVSRNGFKLRDWLTGKVKL